MKRGRLALDLVQTAFHRRRVDQHRSRCTRRASGLRGTNFTGGNAIWPARSSMSNMPRHIMSRKAHKSRLAAWPCLHNTARTA